MNQKLLMDMVKFMLAAEPGTYIEDGNGFKAGVVKSIKKPCEICQTPVNTTNWAAIAALWGQKIRNYPVFCDNCNETNDSVIKEIWERFLEQDRR